jgi:hypothetical protein
MSRIGSYPVTDTVKSSQRVVAYDPNGQATVMITVSQLLDYIVQNQDIPASEITFNPDGTPYTVDNVQDALVWINDALETHVNNTTGAHAASAVSFDDTISNLKGASVKEALENAGAAATKDTGTSTGQIPLAEDVTIRSTGSEFATYGGTADAITLTTSRTLSALTAGMEFRYIPSNTNTTAFTINVDGIGPVNAKTVTKSTPPAGYHRSGFVTVAKYDGTNFIVSREVERGVSGDWEYSRQSDGSVRLITEINVTEAISSAFQGGFRSAVNQYLLPFTLSATPVVNGNITSTSDGFDVASYGESPSAIRAFFTSVSSQSSASRTAKIVVDGFWYNL